MSEKPDHSPRPPAGTQKNVSLSKRLARLKRRVSDALSHYQRRLGSRAAGPIQDDAFWASILTGEKERECPARDFRQTSFQLRKAGNLTAADHICSRGVALHPSDLQLAIEHAEIAKAAKDQPARMARWQRVLDLAGNKAPLSAFRNLADCHRNHGNFELAESIIRRGLQLHPGDFSLMAKLTDILSASGASAAALDALRSLIDAHPDQDHAAAYLRMGSVLAGEGLLDRAAEALREGLGRYPASTALHHGLAELVYLRDRTSKLLPTDSLISPQTAHLFQERCEPFGQGTLCFSTGHDALRRHIPVMLDFAETVAPPDVPRRLPEAEVFAVWGAPSAQNPMIRELAALEDKPLLCLDSGFLSSSAVEGKDHPAYSVIVCPGNIHFDTTHPSYLENRLNATDYILTESQRSRSENAITSIVSNRLSKFNHAPRMDLRPRFPANGTTRILLIDQIKGGSSIHWSLGGLATFERMLETALAMQDHEILIKLHPETISGRAASNLLALIPDPLPRNIVIIDFDVNPFDLFDVVDKVFVCTSQLGFEAVLAGKEVHCFAAPYYSGWGFTHDELAIPRRHRQRTPAEVFHLYHIVHSRYFVPGQGAAEIEDLIAFLASPESAATPVPAEIESVAEEAVPAPDPLRILIVIPNHRYGPTGRYSQDIGAALTRLGCEIMVLCEGSCPALDAGVHWRTLTFEGNRMAEKLRTAITAFAPHFIYENGVRSRAQRAALEAVMLTGARFALHSADDDVQVHISRKGSAAADKLVALDQPELTTEEIEKFLRELDWKHSLHVLLDPEFDRWIEPILRVLCYRMASLHTAIWRPFEERLANEYRMPTLIVPPVASAVDFARIPLTPMERKLVLNRYGIGHERTVIFINGSLYSYSAEYSLFLDALNLAVANQGGTFALVIVSGRSALPIARMARERLDERIEFADLGVAEDETYMEMLKACDVVCSPGLPDTFNRYRLPSRLVKAMAMAKPILTCRCGFGESLENGENAFLMDGEDPAAWTSAIIMSNDANIRSKVGMRGREFALEHFDALRVATALKRRFEQSLCEPPHRLAMGIEFSADDSVRSRPKFRLRSRHHSPLQPAIHALALRTHRLDTVVHLGSGKCDELEDYCRLGAKQITLPEGSSEDIGNLDGTIVSMDLDVALPTASGNFRHLLVVKEENEPEEIFSKTPAEVLQRFRWIIAHSRNGGANVLEAAGFRVVPLPVDYTGTLRHCLFEQIDPPPGLT